ncbi:MAG: M13 family metallopeptidase N-terminal domain-containing protein [Candidatus Binatia bacterium]
MAVALAGCSPPAAPPASTAPATVPLTSGLDVASFDRSVRPQDDLFRYVNGGWLARTEIPADKASVGGFTDAYDRTQDQLKAIVEAAAANPGPPGSPAQKIGDFYTAFMDEARADQLGLTPLKAELDRINGLATKADLAAYMARQFMLGVDGAPIVGEVEGDAQEPTQSVLYLFQGGLGMPDRDYYLSNDAKLVAVRAKYRSYLGALLAAAGVANPKAEADGVLALETTLARAHWTQVESRDAVKTYNRVAVKDLAAKFPGLDWSAWTTALGVQGAPHLIVSQPSFFVALGKAVETTPLTRWKSHLVAHTIDRFAPYLSTTLVNTRFEFRGKALQGIQALQPRWKRAIANLDAALGEQLGQLYGKSREACRPPRRGWIACRQPARRLQDGHRPAAVDGARHAARGPGEAGGVPAEDRLPVSGATTRRRDPQGRSRR